MSATKHVIDWLTAIPREAGDAELVTNGVLTPAGMEYAFKCSESRNAAPWNSALFSAAPGDKTRYSIFPLVDEYSLIMYRALESSIWSDTHLEYEKDAEQFEKLPKRYQELFIDLVAFFAPGDGVISAQALRFLAEADSAEQAAFLQLQLANENVHSLTYSTFITSIIPNKDDQANAFSRVMTLPCVANKISFIEKWMDSCESRGKRYFVGALTEGVFFVSLFSIIFFFRRKSDTSGKRVFDQFITANEWISRDEMVHRDYNCSMAKRYGEFSVEEAYEITRDAVAIELEHCKYILRTYVDSEEADAGAGLTIEAISGYVETLADHILRLVGIPTLYNKDVSLPWMSDLSNGVTVSSFYDATVTQYRLLSKREAVDNLHKMNTQGPSNKDTLAAPKAPEPEPEDVYF